MIFNRNNGGVGPGTKPWEGTQPLTSKAIVDFFHPTENGTAKIASPEQALGPPSVYRAAQLIAGSVAASDRHVTEDDGTIIDDAESIVVKPNPMIDPFIFWENALMSLLFHGNFYAIAIRDGGGSGPIKNLTPLNPTQVTPMYVTRGTGKRTQIIDTVYEWAPATGEKHIIPATDMFHIVGMGFDGLSGMSVLRHGAQAISNSLSSDVYAGRFYSNGSLISGVLTTDKRLDEKTAGALKNRWRQKIQGIDNAFDIVVLDAGTSFQPISLSPQDAQFIEARRYNVEDIGRLFGIPKELLGEAGETSPIDPEKVAITFTQFTLRTWVARIEEAASKQLLPEGKRMKIVINDLVQADERTRSSAAVMWRKANVKSINDIRVQEGLAPIDHPDADDVFFQPVSEGAIDPGANQGAEEQPVPNEQDPNGESANDMNES